jgi:hypothetical protein
MGAMILRLITGATRWKSQGRWRNRLAEIINRGDQFRLRNIADAPA